MDATFYNGDVYTLTLAALAVIAAGLLALLAYAFKGAAEDRYRGTHRMIAPGRAAAITAAPPVESREVEVWTAHLPEPVRRVAHSISPRWLQAEAHAGPPIRFPATDSALEVFRRNMDSVIAALA